MMIPPLPPRDDRPDGEKGFVSLRDHFATAAMQALVTYHPGGLREDYAREAYNLADAMLIEQSRANYDDAAATKCVLSDDEIAAIRHAIVWLPPAYNPQHVTLRRLLERAS